VPDGKANQVTIDSVVFQKPGAQFKVQLERADNFGDLEWQQEPGARVGQASLHRIVGIVEFQLRIGGDVQLVLIVLIEAPLHSRERLAQPALQRTAVRALK
jgi:hypothetical protein